MSWTRILAPLTGAPSDVQVLEAAADRTVTRVLPKLVFGENDQLRFLLPHEPDYPKV